MHKTKKKKSNFRLKIKSFFLQKNSRNKGRELVKPNEGLIKLYGFFAILLVLIPEWLAESFITFKESLSQYKIPQKGIAWKAKNELRLASMTCADLRNLAKQEKLIGYSSENRQELIDRLLMKLNKKTKHYERLF